MLKASIIEQYIHIQNSERRLYVSNVDDAFEGKNECYHINLKEFYNKIDIDECLTKVCEFKGYDLNILKYALQSQIKGDK